MADFTIPKTKSTAQARQFERNAARHTTGRTVRITVDLDEELHRRLKVKAATEGRRLADLIRQWADENTRKTSRQEIEQ